MDKQAILSAIKAQVLKVVPGAKVMLFGSRANGVPADESDWDILILTPDPVNASLKKNIHNALFPISMKIATFINTITVHESDWHKNPSYYSLYQSISTGMADL